MKIFDIELNSEEITYNDFCDAVDTLISINQRTGYKYCNAYRHNNKFHNLNKNHISAVEYENWIKSVFIFIEKFDVFYNKNTYYFKQVDIEYIFDIYVIFQYLKFNNSPLLFLNYAMQDSSCGLSDFVRTSQRINYFIMNNQNILKEEKYKNFSSYLDDDIVLEIFPFSSCKLFINNTEIDFYALNYMIFNYELYELKYTFLNNKILFGLFNHDKLSADTLNNTESKLLNMEREFYLAICECEKCSIKLKNIADKNSLEYISTIKDYKMLNCKIENMSIEIENFKFSNDIIKTLSKEYRLLYNA